MTSIDTAAAETGGDGMEQHPRRFSGSDRDPDIETSDLGLLGDEAFRTVDGAQSESPWTRPSRP